MKADRDLDDKISILYLTGHSTYQIADELEIERDRVRSSLDRTKTPRRPIAEAMSLRFSLRKSEKSLRLPEGKR